MFLCLNLKVEVAEGHPPPTGERYALSMLLLMLPEPGALAHEAGFQAEPGPLPFGCCSYYPAWLGTQGPTVRFFLARLKTS